MASMVDCTGPDLGLVLPVPDEVYAHASGHAASIIGHVRALASRAASLRQQAEATYSSVAGALSASLPDAQLQVALSNYSVLSQSLPDMPQLAALPNLSAADFGALPTLRVDALQRSAIDAPQTTPLAFPEPPSLAATAALPQDAALGTVPTVPDIPLVTFHVDPLPALGDIPQLALSTTQISWSDFAPIANVEDVAMPVPDRAKGAAANVFTPAPYTYEILPSALQLADSWLSGEFGFSMDDANTAARTNLADAANLHAQRIASVWARRGFARDDSDVRSTYADRVRRELSDDVETFQRGLEVRARMRQLPQLLQTVVSGHAVLADIWQRLYAADFAMLATEREVQLQVLGALSTYAQERVRQYAVQTARYAALIATIHARVEAHLAAVKAEVVKGKINAAKSEAYAAAQDAQTAKVQAYEAHYRAALAVVEAYNAMVQAVQTRAKLAGVSLLQFEAQSESWAAQLQAAKASYDLRSAQNRAIVAQNQALASQVAAGALQADIVAAESSAAATDVVAQVAQLKALLMERLGEYLGVEQANAAASTQAIASSQQGQIEAVRFGAATLPLRTEYSAIADINNSATGNAAAVAQTMMSVARDVQSQRIQLANAYVDLYRAVADAEAARVTGRASAMRADVRLTARGDVGFSTQISNRVDKQTSASVSRSNECVSIFRPLTN